MIHLAMIWMTVNDVVMFFAADWFGFQCLSLGCHIASAIPRNTGVRFWIKRGKGLFFQRFMWMQRFRRIHLIISRESTGKRMTNLGILGGTFLKKRSETMVTFPQRWPTLVGWTTSSADTSLVRVQSGAGARENCAKKTLPGTNKTKLMLHCLWFSFDFLDQIMLCSIFCCLIHNLHCSLLNSQCSSNFTRFLQV